MRFFFLFWCSAIIAQTPFNSSVSGNWTAGATWVGGIAPSLTGGANNLSGSNVTIEADHSVTLTSSLTVKSTSTITINGTLTIDGLLDFENGCTILINPGGELICNNAVNSNNSTDITINGTFTVNGDLNLGAGSDMTGSGSVAVSGTSSGSGTVFGSAFNCDDCDISSDGTITDNLTIYDGNAVGLDIPIDRGYYNSYSEQIYLQSEINKEGTIQEISFEYNGYSSWSRDIQIYMGHTSKTNFVSTSDWITSATMTKVFDGPISVTTTAGWYTLILDSDFSYNNIDNLVIAVDYSYSGNYNSSDSFYSYGLGGSSDRSLVYSNDSNDPDPASPPSGSVVDYVPSLKLRFGPPPTVLPITLSYFGGTCNEGGNDIMWVTSSESNSSHFTLKRSIDGKNWKEIGHKQGAGNSSTDIEYNVKDLSGHRNPISYYRLHQYDYNNDSAIYGPISVECSNIETSTSGRLTPNPAIEASYLTIENCPLGDATITLMSSTGEVIYTERLVVTKPNDAYFIDALDLARGSYIIRFVAPNNDVISMKLVKN